MIVLNKFPKAKKSNRQTWRNNVAKCKLHALLREVRAGRRANSAYLFIDLFILFTEDSQGISFF
jgi:hypothetical protein